MLRREDSGPVPGGGGGGWRAGETATRRRGQGVPGVKGPPAGVVALIWNSLRKRRRRHAPQRGVVPPARRPRAWSANSCSIFDDVVASVLNSQLKDDREGGRPGVPPRRAPRPPHGVRGPRDRAAVERRDCRSRRGPSRRPPRPAQQQPQRPRRTPSPARARSADAASVD